MNSYFYVYFNLSTDVEMGIRAATRPVIPIAQKNMKQQNIDGHNGSIIEDMETYEDIEIDIEFNFNNEDYYLKERQARNWLTNIKENKLKFSDDPGYFYKVKKVEISGEKRVLNTFGELKAKFICDPFVYLEEGEEGHLVNKNETYLLYNDGIESLPIIEVAGEGLVVIQINGEEIRINVSGEAVIDSVLKEVYRKNNELINTSMKGYFPVLKQGSNTVLFTSESSINNIRIIPNWRCL